MLNTGQAMRPAPYAKELSTATRNARNAGEIGLTNGSTDVVRDY